MLVVFFSLPLSCSEIMTERVLEEGEGAKRQVRQNMGLWGFHVEDISSIQAISTWLFMSGGMLMFPVSKTKWGGKKSEMTREMRNGDGHHTNCSHAGGLLIPHMVKCWQKKAFREGREGKGERERENLDFFFTYPRAGVGSRVYRQFQLTQTSSRVWFSALSWHLIPFFL